MSLNLQDVDLTSLLQANASSEEPCTPSPLSICELYEADLTRLEQALRKVANIETLSIGKLSNEPSFLYHDFVAKCLAMLSSVYPALKTLRLDGDFQHHDLAFLKCFRNLESFSFDGFSSSSPVSTAQILSELDALSNLSLTSQHGRPTPDPLIHTETTAKRQSFTGDVVSTFDRPKPSTVTNFIAVTPLALLFASIILVSKQQIDTLRKHLYSLFIHTGFSHAAVVRAYA
jgi:hypothetical protein